MHCTECDFEYCEDISENVKEHDAFHDKRVRGLYVPSSDGKDVIYESNMCRITLVTDTSPIAEQQIAEDVGYLTQLDTHYTCPFAAGRMPDEKRVHVFLYHAASRIIGFLMVQRRRIISRVTWRNVGESPL